MIEGGSVGLGRSDGAQRRALLLSALLVLARLRVSFAYSCAAVCTPGFALSAAHPVVLDGKFVKFSVELKAKRTVARGQAPHGVPLDTFHVNEQVREFCWFSHIKLIDCNAFVDSVQVLAQSTWENATASCRCAVEDADVQLVSRRIVRWGGSSTSEESL